MIKDIIDKVLKEIHVDWLSEDERYQVMAQLAEHFNKVIIDTILNNCNEDQLREFKTLIDIEDQSKMEEQISLFVAKIPAINYQIEEALNNEIAHIKAAKEIIDR
jgi:hypothetical protein